MAVLNAKRSLVAGIFAAIGASVCCVGPLVLLALGIGGAWIGNLTALERFRPIFIALTLLLLGLAFYRLYPTAPVCAPAAACAGPIRVRHQRIVFWLVGVLLLGLLAVPSLAPLFD